MHRFHFQSLSLRLSEPVILPSSKLSHWQANYFIFITKLAHCSASRFWTCHIDPKIVILFPGKLDHYQANCFIFIPKFVLHIHFRTYRLLHFRIPVAKTIQSWLPFFSEWSSNSSTFVVTFQLLNSAWLFKNLEKIYIAFATSSYPFDFSLFHLLLVQYRSLSRFVFNACM
jgi:hypothetical protein